MNIIQGDILSFDGDAIVNPANSFLRHGAGLAKIIADAAAPWPKTRATALSQLNAQCVRDRAWRDEQRDHPLIPTGGVGVTSAGALPYEGIIHAVGPIWDGGNLCEHTLLNSAHRRAIQAARERGWRRIAFPAISCGIFGFPVQAAAAIAVRTAKLAELRGDIQISFYLFEDAHVEAYRAAEARCKV